MFELFDPKEGVRVREGANLPHWFQPGVSYFVTFRTDDSIPTDVAQVWHRQRREWLERHGISMREPNWSLRFQALPERDRREFHETFSREYLESLDKGLGECVLQRADLNRVVAESLRSFDGRRYHLGDFVVMPNHVHLVVALLGNTEIEAQCTSWKRFTARQINQRLGKQGRFWQEESFDHLIRSVEQFEAIGRYIAANPRSLTPGTYILDRRADRGN